MRNYLIYIFLIILASCTRQNVSISLAEIENMVYESPDSALQILRTIPTESLSTDYLRAEYSLLMATALDKNYIDVCNDSLAMTAVQYYSKKPAGMKLARSLYYLGLSYYYSGDYNQAILEFTKAERVAEKHDSLYLGFVKVLQADTYNMTYNVVEQKNSLQKALEVYQSLNQPYYTNVAKYNLARAYLNNKEYERADSLYEALLSSDIDDRMRGLAMADQSFLQVVKDGGNIGLALRNFTQLNNLGLSLTPRHYWAWAYALLLNGDKDLANGIINQIGQIDTSGTASFWQYKIAKKDKQYIAALKHLEDFMEKDAVEVSQVLKQSLSIAQRDYYHSQYEIFEYEADVRKLMVICLFSISLLVFGSALLIVLKLKKHQKEEKIKYIQYAEGIKRQLKDFANDSYSKLMHQYITSYKSRYETIGALFDQYVQFSGRVNQEKLIYRKVVSMIDELRRDIENINGLEKVLDQDLDGVMSKLRSDLPNLKEKDVALFTYSAIGFDATIISHIMNTSVNSVYIRKSRLKNTIEEKASADNKNIFIQLLSEK